jgi:hypothetical protein
LLDRGKKLRKSVKGAGNIVWVIGKDLTKERESA